jgi:hypothetical protein
MVSISSVSSLTTGGEALGLVIVASCAVLETAIIVGEGTLDRSYETLEQAMSLASGLLTLLLVLSRICHRFRETHN